MGAADNRGRRGAMIKGELAGIAKNSGVPPKNRPQAMPGPMLVRIQEQAVRPHLGSTPVALSAAGARRLPAAVSEPLDYLRRNAGLKAVRPLFSMRRGGGGA